MKKKLLMGFAFIFLIAGIIYFTISIMEEVSKTYVELNKEFTLKKSEKVFVDVDGKEFEIQLTKIHNTSCPKDALCEPEVRQVSIRVNGEGYVLTAISNNYINIEGTNYNLYYIPTYNPNKDTFIISANTETKISYTVDNNMSEYGSKYSKRGYYVDTLNQPNAPWYYTIAMGTQYNGGYGIMVKDVNIDDFNNVEVIVQEIVPEPGSIVTQALTYPTCKVTFDKLPTSIVIKNTEGDIFEETK